jgi:alpha-methylacyl-CoA racemase
MRVIELLGKGPGPFCGMVLADLGADVVRIERPGPSRADPATDVLARGKRSCVLDLKSADGVAAALGLIAKADALIDPFRPGVAEKLGLGPDECLAANPCLVYGRMTGWGQSGPHADQAGHDINYIALSGALSLCGRADGPPVPPVNMLGDFDGGAMFLAVGILAAAMSARETGQGQVVDAAMIDGSALLTAMTHQMRAAGAWGPRGTNLLDSGAPFYDVYETADGGWMSVGAMEAQFYAELLDVLGLADDSDMRRAQRDRVLWPELRARLTKAFATRTRAQWAQAFAGRDACVAPVLDLDEAEREPHLHERGTYTREFGVTQPAPAPRFSLTPSRIAGPPPMPGQHTDEVLRDWGVTAPAQAPTGRTAR